MENRPPKRSALQSILDIDQEIMKLITRRSHILLNLRRAKGRGSMPEVQTEKQLRQAWEREAGKLSRDPKMVRQLFTLLQEVEVIQFNDVAETRGAFNLSPAPRPVDITLPGMPSQRELRLRVALAAALGAPCSLTVLVLSDTLSDFMKSLNQAGAELSYDTSAGILTSKQAERPQFADRVIYAGDDTLSFYLLSAMALSSPGKTKFTGAANLKIADFSIWRNTLPLVGSRLANMVPKSNGLPVHQECSAMFPQKIVLPEALPYDGVLSLVLMSCTWDTPVTFEAGANPHLDAVMNELTPIFSDSDVRFSRAPGEVSVQPGATVRQKPSLPMDPFLSAVLLAFPVIAGGRSAVSGSWDDANIDCKAFSALFKAAGLNMTVSKMGIEGKAGTGLALAQDKSALSIDLPALVAAAANLDVEHLPLSLVIFAGAARVLGSAPLALTGRDGKSIDFGLAQDFLGRLGFSVQEGDAPCIVPRADADSTYDLTWTSPDPVWAMAFSLGAYLRSGIKLTNPGIVADLMPAYWTFFNGLPVPSLASKPKDAAPEKPKRRRIITE